MNLVNLYKKSISELIKHRISVRTYKLKSIPEHKKAELEKFISSNEFNFQNKKLDFNIIEKNPNITSFEKFSDYGLIKHHSNYIVGKINPTDELAYERYGYLLESIVLKATELELGTCWVGIFNPSYLSEIKLVNNEIIPAISVIGIPADLKSFKEILIRKIVRASKRKDNKVLFFDTIFGKPLSLNLLNESYQNVFELMRLAPSAGNVQPWRIIKKNNYFHFYRKKGSKLYDKKHLHRIDMGIAMSHFELSNIENNLSGEWVKCSKNLPSNPIDLIYTISWKM